MHIKLYSSLDPRRFQEPVKSFKAVIDLLKEPGEPLIVEAIAPQKELKLDVVINRNVTFIGHFSASFILQGQSIVKFDNATIQPPNTTKYTLKLDENYTGIVSVLNKSVIKSNKDGAAIATFGNQTSGIAIYNSVLQGILAYTNLLYLKGSVQIDSDDNSEVNCGEITSENCKLKIKNLTMSHPMKQIPILSLETDGSCHLKGSYVINHIIIANTTKSLDALKFSDATQGLILGAIDNDNIPTKRTALYINNSAVYLTDDIAKMNIVASDSVISLASITDNAKWAIHGNTHITMEPEATSDLAKYATTAEVVEPEQTKTAMEQLNEMIGQNKVKQQLADFVAQSDMAKLRAERGIAGGKTITRNMVFSGPPGVGKTAFARLVARALHECGVLPSDKVVEVSAAKDLIDKYIGATAERTHNLAKSAYGGVLFVDEAYALAHDDNGQFGAKAIEQLLKEADDHRDELVIILAGYEKDMKYLFDTANEGLSRRFPHWITFENYDYNQYVQIFELMLRQNNCLMNSQIMAMKGFKTLLTNYAGGNANAGGVRNFVEALILARDSRLTRSKTHLTDEDLMTITVDDLKTVHERRSAELKGE